MEINQYKHVHAELMTLYAEDAMKTPKPWLLWEFKKSTEHSWSECYHSPEWCESNNYRRKLNYININGYNVPESLREEPEMHTNLNLFGDTSKHDLKNEITLNQIFGAILDKLSDGAYDSRQEKLDNIDSAISLHQAALAELQQQRDEIKVRRTGRTLGIAFTALGRALTNPNTNIQVIDHVNTRHANLILIEYIETLIGKLGLKNIHVNKTKTMIRYVLPQ